MLSPLFVDVAASGDITTRNQQLAQVITGEDKTLHLTQKVITVRMLGDIAVANGTYTLHHKVNSAEVDEKGVFTHVFERLRGRLAVHQLAAHRAARGLQRQAQKGVQALSCPSTSRSSPRATSRISRKLDNHCSGSSGPAAELTGSRRLP